MGLVFKVQHLDDFGRMTFLIGFVIITVIALHFSPTFRLAVELCATAAAPAPAPAKANSKGSRLILQVLLMFQLVSAVLWAVLPVSLNLRAYTGEDSPEAVTKIMVISIFSAARPLVPAMVFYVSKVGLFKRTIQYFAIALVILSVVIGIAPGGPEAIVYSSASLMKVRNESASKFLLTEVYAVDDSLPTFGGAWKASAINTLSQPFHCFRWGTFYCYAQRN